MAESPKHITLSELQVSISQTLRERFALPVWVSAEVSDIKVNYSGHCYLELIEKGESDGVARAQARAVIWRNAYPRIVGYFEAESGAKLERGVRVLVKVVVNYHELYGLSLQITDIDATYTLGDMERQRQKTIAQLESDGVWDMNREQPMPMLVQRIAIISSRTAAGYQDFCNELARGGYHFEVTLFDSLMQGTGAEDSIVDSLCAIAEVEERFDVVAIIRGGGSTSDLNCFNSYRLSSYVAQFPLPVIAGIGHDKDQSVVDLVAQVSLKTPTAVAGWFVERSASIDAWLNSAAVALHDLAISSSRKYDADLQRFEADLTSLTDQFLTNSSQHLTITGETLTNESTLYITRQSERLTHAMEIVESHSPDRLLKLGFSLLRTLDTHKAISSANELKIDDHIEIKLSDGVIGAVITDFISLESNREQ
ncbi:MAG: exodeoxyribonuclease VII large subunit [Rikenellaceae bacterium]